MFKREIEISVYLRQRSRLDSSTRIQEKALMLELSRPVNGKQPSQTKSYVNPSPPSLPLCTEAKRKYRKRVIRTDD